MSRLAIYGIIALAIVGAVTAVIAGIYHKGYAAGEARIKGEWDAAALLQRQKEASQADAAARSLEVEREQQQVVVQTITKTVDRIVDRPIYRNVCLDPDGLCVANASIRGESADSCKPAPAMPANGRTAGWNGSFGLALDYGERGVLSGLRGEAPLALGGG